MKSLYITFMVLILCMSTIYSQNSGVFPDLGYQAVTNVQVAYQENALYVSWELPDSLITIDSSIIAKFHISYVETDIEHIHLLDSALYWNMPYAESWEWEIGANVYEYFFVLPKRVFPPYTSLIRIGVAAEYQYIDPYGYPYWSVYSRVSLAPDIVNKSLLLPTNVTVINK